MPKRILPLSDIQVKNAKPQTKQVTLFDGGGLFLLVTPTGGKAIHGIENIGSDVKEQILETVNQAVDTWLRSALLMDVSGSRRQILAESNCES